ncbi:MAG TPA: hypothetical protein VNL77_01415 [Roseiflexaceae bacterium]|nr:hypothetical protein [Roseiflexaceae bacterium]
MTVQIDTRRPASFRPIATLEMAADWRAAAVEAYRQTKDHDRAVLRADLASRILTLTGRRVAAEQIVSDDASRSATAAVDGVVFQLRSGVLTIVRPCGGCALGTYSSPPIASRADLGYALMDWEPRCPSCLPEDEDEDRSWSW